MGRSYSSGLRVRIYGEIEQGGSRRAAIGSLEPARQGRPPGGGKLAPNAEPYPSAECRLVTAVGS